MWTWGFAVSRMCYQMISDELTTTPLGTETAQNHFSTKAERMLLVTNATEYLSVEWVSEWVNAHVLFLCECFVIWRANQERASYTRSHSGSPQKSHLLTMYCAIHIFALMSKVESSLSMTPRKSRLSISASGAIFSSLVDVFVCYGPVFSSVLLPTLNLYTPTTLVCLNSYQ